MNKTSFRLLVGGMLGLTAVSNRRKQRKRLKKLKMSNSKKNIRKVQVK